MAHQEIYCTVNSCYYYGSGDVCTAQKILIRHNPATLGTDMEVGALGDEAHDSAQTLCETFIPKDRGPKPGIARINR
ncbi:MAG TPA: DUF1540 domain-containing protein [Symbiobacteriaceae bacterium]